MNRFRKKNMEDPGEVDAFWKFVLSLMLIAILMIFIDFLKILIDVLMMFSCFSHQIPYVLMTFHSCTDYPSACVSDSDTESGSEFSSDSSSALTLIFQ